MTNFWQKLRFWPNFSRDRALVPLSAGRMTNFSQEIQIWLAWLAPGIQAFSKTCLYCTKSCTFFLIQVYLKRNTAELINQDVQESSFSKELKILKVQIVLHCRISNVMQDFFLCEIFLREYAIWKWWGGLFCLKKYINLRWWVGKYYGPKIWF